MKKRFLAVMLAVMVAVTYMPKGMGFAESVQARSSDKPKKTEATKEKSEQKFNKTKKASDKLPSSNPRSVRKPFHQILFHGNVVKRWKSAELRA